MKKEGCPSCGGKGGFSYKSTQVLSYIGVWDDRNDRELTDADQIISESMVTCHDCGKRFQWSTIEKMFYSRGLTP